ncbi:MAG: signal peptidase I [Lachnospiraceae bacterium]|nr:signal peptidase I [Lachnospiraceae bacterium]
MKKIIKEIFSTSLYLLVVLLITYLLVNYVVQRTEVVGSSMENTLMDGDNLLIDKLGYRWKDPERFDIIAFLYQHGEDVHYIKRIIGLPGETVRIDREGNIYIDGEMLTEGYGKEVILNPGIAEEEILLGEDEFFVLGDNRNHSADSRESNVGNIRREDIVGRAWLRIWPLGDFGILRHQ